MHRHRLLLKYVLSRDVVYSSCLDEVLTHGLFFHATSLLLVRARFTQLQWSILYLLDCPRSPSVNEAHCHSKLVTSVW